MTQANHCPQCGTPLPLDAPPGICPRCVLSLGFDSSLATAAAPAGDPARARLPLPATGPATPVAGFLPPEPKALAPLFPQLEILDLLGQDGMGAVYRARQTKLDRFVALKILPPEVGQDPAFAERFSREARTLARLTHPGIVGIYDFGQTGSVYYLTMEYVDGSNLRQVIEAGQLTPAEALAIVPQVCEALQYAHDEGVVHRDIKPENILLDKRGRAKIADFGLARLLAHPADSFTLTDTQQVMGTPHYMAPEQLASTHAVDHRADIYSLGVVFYEMLTGELPLGRFEMPSKRAGVDARLDDVVLRTLERAPERRYQQARAVKTDVEAISNFDAHHPTLQLGADAWPARPEMPPAPAATKHPRGTIGRAWDAWWVERDRWFTVGVQGVLSAVAMICLILFISFSLSNQAVNGHDKLRHLTIQVGSPSPWFHFESYPEPLVPFRWRINYMATSMLAMALGSIAWYVYWQIEKAKPQPRFLWLGSANTIIIFWALLMALIPVFVIFLHL